MQSTRLPWSRKYSRQRQRQVGRLPPHQRRLVRGRDHHDGLLDTDLAEIFGDEFLHFAAALADQPDDRDIDLALRASIDISTDLPTPEPAKMPMRWPSHMVVKVLSARTPMSIGSPTRARSCAGSGVCRSG